MTREGKTDFTRSAALIGALVAAGLLANIAALVSYARGGERLQEPPAAAGCVACVTSAYSLGVSSLTARPGAVPGRDFSGGAR